MSDAFYKAFEDKYRGSRSFIKSQLQVYLPYLQALQKIHPKGSAIDLACSRGEWLEILNETGYDSFGTDTDRGLIALCQQRGLNVKHVDPLDALIALSDESQAIVSGFHLAEHIPFDHLKALTKEAFRVLKPGGILILETPNPENMFVGSHRFYMDPRHTKPLPPLLLAFVPEYYGFTKIQVLRLHEQTKSARTQALTLCDALSGVSPTYAVIAQKATVEDQSGVEIDSIEPLHGVKLETLTDTYDQQLEQQFAKLKATASEALELAKDAEGKLNYIHGSLSWRLTRPLRWLDHQLNLLKEHGPFGRIKAFARRVMTSLVNRAFNFAATRPKVNALGTVLIKKTGLHARLCAYLVKAPVEIVIQPPTIEEEDQAYRTDLRLAYMDAEAKAIYSELKSKIEQREGLRS